MIVPVAPQTAPWPKRGEAPNNYAAMADAVGATMPATIDGVNAVATFTNQRAIDAQASATAASNSAAAAASSATTAAQQAQAATNNGAAQVALAAAQAQLATDNGAAQVALAAEQVALANTARTGAEAAQASAETAAAAAGAAAGLPALAGNSKKVLRVKTDETGVEFAALGQAIGDILFSTYAPDNTYLPADGSVYLKSSYPALSGVSRMVGDLSRTTGIAKAMPGNEAWSGVAFGNGVFVAIANGSAAVAVSSDGINWTQGSLPSSAAWISIAFGNGVFVAVASGSSSAAVSSDGVNWTSTLLPASSSWISITFGNGVFVAITTLASVAATSTNGINWTQRVLPNSVQWVSVAYGRGMFVAIAGGSSQSTSAAFSHDGAVWTTATLPVSHRWASVAFGNGLFVAVAETTDGTNSPMVVAVSWDGISWSLANIPSARSHAIAYAEGWFVAVPPSSGGSALLSRNGFDWVLVKCPLYSYLSRTLAYGNGVLVAVSTSTYPGHGYWPAYWYDRATQFALPDISTPSGVSAFIKAKP